jgi:hypothetical protein
MRTYFHLTPAENIPGILKEGLIPRLGVIDTIVTELGPAVFFFPSYDCVEDALLSWYGEISEGEDIALLEVELNLDEIPLYYSNYARKPTVSTVWMNRVFFSKDVANFSDIV